MSKDTVTMGTIALISTVLLLIFVKKNQIRTAIMAFLLAQLFSWPTTILFVQFGLQENPFRLFPHATEGNFLFAFIFHPSIFTVYYLHYPKSAQKLFRALFLAFIVAMQVLFQLVVSLLTNLVYYPSKLVPFDAYVLILIIFSISRVYLDWFFAKNQHPERSE